jgi:hypothetical protein
MHIFRMRPARASARSTGQGLGTFERAGLAPVEDDQWVKVTVAGVKDVRAAHARLTRKLADVTQGLAEPAPGHHSVLHDEIG